MVAAGPQQIEFVENLVAANWRATPVAADSDSGMAAVQGFVVKEHLVL